MDQKIVSGNIKTLRIINNLTQEELAKKLYITKQAVSKWENELCLPDIINIKNYYIINVFPNEAHVSVAQLDRATPF